MPGELGQIMATPEQVPAAPSNLTATAASSSQIDLHWMIHSTNEIGFKIERKYFPSHPSFTEIGEVPHGLSTYFDMNVERLTTYTYRVRAYNGAGYSAYSNEASATPPLPPADFSLSCDPSPLDVLIGGNATTTCTVRSLNGFIGTVTLSYNSATLPPGVTCGFSPNPVTPSFNGTVNSTLTVNVGPNVPGGYWSFLVVGTSGSLTRTFDLQLRINDFGVTCTPSSLTAGPGGNATSTCRVRSYTHFSSAVTLSCEGQPAGVICTFSQGMMTPPANGSVNSSLWVRVGQSVNPGVYVLRVVGVSGGLVHTFDIQLTVIGTPQQTVDMGETAADTSLLGDEGDHRGFGAAWLGESTSD